MYSTALQVQVPAPEPAGGCDRTWAESPIRALCKLAARYEPERHRDGRCHWRAGCQGHRQTCPSSPTSLVNIRRPATCPGQCGTAHRAQSGHTGTGTVTSHPAKPGRHSPERLIIQVPDAEGRLSAQPQFGDEPGRPPTLDCDLSTFNKALYRQFSSELRE